MCDQDGINGIYLLIYLNLPTFEEGIEGIDIVDL